MNFMKSKWEKAKIMADYAINNNRQWESYCEDDKHEFIKMTLSNQVIYICKTCRDMRGYINA